MTIINKFNNCVTHSFFTPESTFSQKRTGEAALGWREHYCDKSLIRFIYHWACNVHTGRPDTCWKIPNKTQQLSSKETHITHDYHRCRQDRGLETDLVQDTEVHRGIRIVWESRPWDSSVENAAVGMDMKICVGWAANLVPWGRQVFWEKPEHRQRGRQSTDTLMKLAVHSGLFRHMPENREH